MFTSKDKLFLTELLTQKQYMIIANLINKYKEE